MEIENLKEKINGLRQDGQDILLNLREIFTNILIWTLFVMLGIFIQIYILGPRHIKYLEEQKIQQIQECKVLLKNQN